MPGLRGAWNEEEEEELVACTLSVTGAFKINLLWQVWCLESKYLLRTEVRGRKDGQSWGSEATAVRWSELSTIWLPVQDVQRPRQSTGQHGWKKASQGSTPR